MGSVPVRAPNFEPFGAFRPKINWFGTRKVGSQLEPKNSRFSLRTVMTSVGVSLVQWFNNGSAQNWWKRGLVR